MKRIKDLREHYNIITEKEEHDMNKLTQLVRAGLFDAKKLSALKRAIDKPADKMTAQEKRMMINLLDALMAEVLSDKQVYRKIKQDVMKEAKDWESKDYFATPDPRVKRVGYPSQKEAPSVLLLKRKAIRVFPDGQKVALYYAQAIDKYVTIPYNEIGLSESVGSVISGMADGSSSANSSSSSGDSYSKPLETKLKWNDPGFTGKEGDNRPDAVRSRMERLNRLANQAMARDVRENFKNKLKVLKEYAQKLPYEQQDDDMPEFPKTYHLSGVGIGGPSREKGQESGMFGRKMSVQLPKSANENIPKAANINDLPGMRRTFRSDTTSTKRQYVDPFALPKPAGGGKLSTDSKDEIDSFGQKTAQDKITSDLKNYINKKEIERNIKSDIERELRHSTKIAAIKQAESGFGKETGATAGALSKTKPVPIKTTPTTPAREEPSYKPKPGARPEPATPGTFPSVKPVPKRTHPDLPGPKQNPLSPAPLPAKPATKPTRVNPFPAPNYSPTPALPAAPAAKPGKKSKPDVLPTQQPASQPSSNPAAQPAAANKPAPKKDPKEESAKKQQAKNRKGKEGKPKLRGFILPGVPSFNGKDLNSLEPKLKPMFSAPKREGDPSALASRMSSIERAALKAQASIAEEVTIDLSGNLFEINRRAADKVTTLYESLNTKNKKQMIKMMKENNEQLNKIITFATRQ